MNTIYGGGESGTERLAITVRELDEDVGPNGFVVAAGIAAVASIALRAFGMRQLVRLGPPRVMPIATGLSMLVPILLVAGLASRIHKLGDDVLKR